MTHPENARIAVIGLDDVRAAAERIAPYIRSTPVVEATATRQPIGS